MFLQPVGVSSQQKKYAPLPTAKRAVRRTHSGVSRYGTFWSQMLQVSWSHTWGKKQSRTNDEKQQPMGDIKQIIYLGSIHPRDAIMAYIESSMDFFLFRSLERGKNVMSSWWLLASWVGGGQIQENCFRDLRHLVLETNDFCWLIAIEVVVAWINVRC